MSNEERNAKVDQLLHDAEHAESGAAFAKRIGHLGPAREMEQKAGSLRRQANNLDPKRESPAWEQDAEWQKLPR